MTIHPYALAFASASLLAACGSGNGRIASSPLLPPSTISPATVTIFSNPVPQDYATAGVSTTSAGDGYTSIDQDASLADVTFAPPEQPEIRYNAGGFYELKLPEAAFDRLIAYKGLANPGPDNSFFQTASALQNHATFITGRSMDMGYSYSELAAWTDASTGRIGYLSFGSPTPLSAIPISGKATYKGVTSGQVDVTYYDNLYGGYFFGGIDGYATLEVDFGRGSLTGSLELYVPDGMQPRSVGTYVTSPIQLTASANSFSGRFDTSQPGFNQFNGLFTGPRAQEAIGSWALPLMIDGNPHQAIGAWIAKAGE